MARRSGHNEHGHIRRPHPEAVGVRSWRRDAVHVIVQAAHHLAEDLKVWRYPLCLAALPELPRNQRAASMDAHIDACHPGRLPREVELPRKRTDQAQKNGHLAKQKRNFRAQRPLYAPQRIGVHDLVTIIVDAGEKCFKPLHVLSQVHSGGRKPLVGEPCDATMNGGGPSPLVHRCVGSACRGCGAPRHHPLRAWACQRRLLCLAGQCETDSAMSATSILMGDAWVPMAFVALLAALARDLAKRSPAIC